jgi:uncharacterized protein
MGKLPPEATPSCFRATKVGRKGVKSHPMIPQELLDVLVCPACKKPLVLKDEGKSLKCTECRRVYPVRDDIPIMLVDEAVIDPS